MKISSPATMFPLGLVFLHVLITTCSAQLNEDTPYLLPKTSVPNHYEVDLRLYLGDVYEYKGFVNINITVLQNTDTIVLHSENIDIYSRRSFVYSAKGAVKILKTSVNAEYNFLTLTLQRQIEPGTYGLLIFFSGHFYNNAQGLFLSSYVLPNGEKRYLVASHLEPVHARKIFPCYDEPNLKATFKIRVTHPKDYHAISNSPIESILSKDKVTTTTFGKTVRMSTYLLALAVSDFEVIQQKYNGKSVRFYVKPGDAKNTEFSLNTTLKALHYLEKVLQVNYSLPKLDSIAVPTFGGGMENWGLIVYGRSVSNPSNSIVQNVNLLCHEVAHQWFGNLVTLDWWDYVWLNEGFATYYAQRIADLVHPEGRYMYRHYVGKILSLRYSESLTKEKDSLNRHVEKPLELFSKFNSISYDKGSVIVRFMSIIFKNFDYAITKYLKKYSYSNSVPANLFDQIEESEVLPTGATVEKVMKNWVTSPGYPVITLNITRNGGTRVEIKQERFTLDGTYLPGKWWIPVLLAAEEYPLFERNDTDIWLRDQDESIISYIGNIKGWIIANVRQVVHCRVNYDQENWKKIIEYLKGPDFEKIHMLNRIQLIDDSNNLAKSQRLPEKIALDLLSYLKQEKDELVLKAAGNAIVSYAELLKETPAYEKFKEFVTDNLGPNALVDLSFDFREIEELLENPILDAEKGNTYNEVLYRLTQRLYSMDKVHDLNKRIVGFAKTNNIAYEHYEQLMKDIMYRYSVNLDVKKRFFIYNYPEVKDWLNANY